MENSLNLDFVSNWFGVWIEVCELRKWVFGHEDGILYSDTCSLFNNSAN